MARHFVACNRWCITEVSVPMRFLMSRSTGPDRLLMRFLKDNIHDVYSNFSSELSATFWFASPEGCARHSVSGVSEMPIEIIFSILLVQGGGLS